MHPVTPACVLAGRANELALLDGLLGDLARGSGSAVLIEGEPGIGKTSLVRAALARRPRTAAGTPGLRGCQVFWGAGDELGQELPLLPFLDALRVRGAVGERPAGRDRRAAARRGRRRPRRRRARDARRAAHRAGHRRDRPPGPWCWSSTTCSGPTRPPSSSGAGSRGPPPGAAAADRHDPACPAARGPARAAPRGGRRAAGPARRARPPAVAELVGALAGGRPDTGLLRLAAGAAGNPLYITELLAALARSGGIAVTPGGHRPARGRPRARLAARRHRRPARLRLRSRPAGAAGGGAAGRGVRAHRPDRGARRDRGRPGPRPGRGARRRGARRRQRGPGVPSPADQGGAVRGAARRRARRLAPRRGARARRGRRGAGPGCQAVAARHRRPGTTPARPRAQRIADRRRPSAPPAGPARSSPAPRA